jgi:hypothetical protein
VPVVTVFSVLSTACVVMLTALASKHPLRGGIDVGLPTEIGPGEIYGTALERAYLLKCRVAKYPRLVIGDELWRYLNSALTHFESQTAPVYALYPKAQLINAPGLKKVGEQIGPIDTAPGYESIFLPLPDCIEVVPALLGMDLVKKVTFRDVVQPPESSSRAREAFEANGACGSSLRDFCNSARARSVSLSLS